MNQLNSPDLTVPAPIERTGGGGAGDVGESPPKKEPPNDSLYQERLRLPVNLQNVAGIPLFYPPQPKHNGNNTYRYTDKDVALAKGRGASLRRETKRVHTGD